MAVHYRDRFAGGYPGAAHYLSTTGRLDHHPQDGPWEQDDPWADYNRGLQQQAGHDRHQPEPNPWFDWTGRINQCHQGRFQQAAAPVCLALDGKTYTFDEFEWWYGKAAPKLWREARARLVALEAKRKVALMELVQQRLGADWQLAWQGYVDRLLRPACPWPWRDGSPQRYDVRHYREDVLLDFLKFMGQSLPALPAYWPAYP